MVNAFRLWIWINAHSIALPELSADTIENVRLGIIKSTRLGSKCTMNPSGLLNPLVMVTPWFRKFNLGMKLSWHPGSGLNVHQICYLRDQVLTAEYLI